MTSLQDCITPMVFPARTWCVGTFISTVSELTPEAINADDYASEMEAIGVAVATASARIPRLRPVFNLDLVRNARNGVFLRRISFQAYDPTLTASPIQDGTTNAAIEESLNGTVNDAYMQSRFKNSSVGGWQPNWFRPKVLVNGSNILHSIAGGAFGKNAGDMSIGLPCPWCPEVNLDLGKVQTLEIEAPLFQIVGDKLQPYVVQCVLDLILY